MDVDTKVTVALLLCLRNAIEFINMPIGRERAGQTKQTEGYAI
jgi:hypothetical protein